MATISVFEHTGVGDVITGHQSDAHKSRGGAADFKVGVQNRIRERKVLLMTVVFSMGPISGVRPWHSATVLPLKTGLFARRFSHLTNAVIHCYHRY